MNSPTKITLTILYSLLFILLSLFVVIPRINVRPNWFDANFQVYFSPYSVTAEVTRTNGEILVGQNQTRASRLFQGSMSDIRFVWQKEPVFIGFDVSLSSRTDGDNFHFVWGGLVPIPGLIKEIAVNFAIELDPQDVQVFVNQQKTEFSRIEDELVYFTVPTIDHQLRSVEFIIYSHDLNHNPIGSVYIQEHNVQEIFVKELSFFRDMNRFRFRYPLWSIAGAEIPEFLSVISGGGFWGFHKEFAVFIPTAPRMEIVFHDTPETFLAKNNGPAQHIIVLSSLGLLLVGLITAYLLYFYVLTIKKQQLKLAFLNLQQFIVKRKFNKFIIKLQDQWFFLIIVALVFIPLVKPASLLFWVLVLVGSFGFYRLDVEKTSHQTGVVSPSNSLPHQQFVSHVHRYPDLYSWILLVCLIVIMFGVYHIRLGVFSLWVDEAYSFTPARLILETGVPVYPETGFRYDRALIYHNLIAWVMGITEVSPYAARLPNLFFNAGTMVLIFLFGKRLSRKAGLLAVFLWMMTGQILHMSRWVRMYPMFWFFFLLSCYCFYRAFIEIPNKHVKLQLKGINLSFHPAFAMLFFISFVISVDTQYLSIALVFILFFFYLIQIFINQQRSRALIAFAIITMVFISASLYYRNTLNFFYAFTNEGPGWSRGLSVSPEQFFDEYLRYIPLGVFAFVSLCWIVDKTPIKRFFAISTATIFWFQINQNFLFQRYWSMGYALVVIFVSMTIFRVFNNIKSVYKIIWALTIIFIFSNDIVAFSEEFGNTDTPYSKSTSIITPTNYHMDRVLDYLRIFGEDRLLMADERIAQILHGHGHYVDYVAQFPPQSIRHLRITPRVAPTHIYNIFLNNNPKSMYVVDYKYLNETSILFRHILLSRFGVVEIFLPNEYRTPLPG